MKTRFVIGWLVLISLLLLTSLSYPQEPQEKDLERGIWHYKHENYEEALEVLKKARTKNPDSSLAAYYLGITYKQLQDYKEAKSHLESAVTLTPKIKGALIELIDVLHRLGELEEAKRWVGVAEREGIRPAQVAFLKGLILIREEEDLESAVDVLEEAKELDDALGKVVDYHIGIAHLKAKKLKEAKAVFEKVVREHPATDLASFSKQYLDGIKRREEAMRPLKFALGYAVQYDDNVVLKPTDATLAADVADKGDFREVCTFRGNYDFRPLESLGARAGYSFYYGKQSDLGFYDTVGNNFTLQPSLYFKDAVIGFPAYYNHLVVNDKNYLSLVSVGNLNNITLAKTKMCQAGFTYKNKDYLWTPSTPDEDRDSNEYIGGVSYYYFFAKNRGFFNLRYDMNFEDTEGNNWKYFGNKVTASSLIPLAERLKFTASGEFFLQNFTKKHTIYSKRRRDAISRLSGLLAVEIFKGIETQFQYTFIYNGSNIAVYDYNRNVYSVGVQYKF